LSIYQVLTILSIIFIYTPLDAPFKLYTSTSIQDYYWIIGISTAIQY